MSRICVRIFRVFVSSSDEETSATKSDEPIVKLCRVETRQDNSSHHPNQNMPEEDIEKSPEPVPAVNVTIDLVDSESDKEPGEPVEPGDVSVYNILDSSGSDTNSYTEVCQANALPPSSSDSNHSVGDNQEQVSLLLNSSDDEVEVQRIVTPPQPQPPPPPSDEAMSLVRSSMLSAASQGGDGEPAPPLFVIGRASSSSSHAIRASSDSDEDVRILPSSSRSMKDSKDVIEID